MDKVTSKSKGLANRPRKSGRVTLDKSGKDIWEWQTATGVLEQNITDEQLAELENSQLTFIDQPPPEEPASVSYYEFRERSSGSRASAQKAEPQVGSFKRWLGRWKRK
jgi:hypothetical protein